MTYKEVLNKTQITINIFTGKPLLAIVKNTKNELIEISASRELTEKEIMHYIWLLSQYLLESKVTTSYVISNGKEKLTLKIEQGENE